MQMSLHTSVYKPAQHAGSWKADYSTLGILDLAAATPTSVWHMECDCMHRATVLPFSSAEDKTNALV